VSAIRIEGQLAVATFDRFDLVSYELFLRAKGLPESRVAYDWRTDRYTLTTPARFADQLGANVAAIEREPIDLATHLFDYQRWIVEMALRAKRFAAWCDTGLGKTAIELEYARHVLAATGAKVLILTPLQVIPQMIEMATAFYGERLPIIRLETRDALIAWLTDPGCELGITNDDKFIAGVMPELRHLGGLVYDESSRLKTGGGVIKWNLIKSARGIEYKLSATATPAPNDTMEYASQASFLEKLRTEGEILWTYFVRDKTGNWRVKPHAREAFYRFMATWSVYVRDPSRFGFADILATLPPPDVREYDVPITDAQRDLMYGFIGAKGGMFADDRLTLTERSKLSQLAKGFLYDSSTGTRQVARIPSEKPAVVARLVAEDVADGRQVLVWTVFDEEGDIVVEHLPEGIDAATLSGAQTETQRAEIIARFKSGELRVLISKAQLLGYGLNFQNCRSMVFSGFDDSFERMYQAVRRAYRYGQTETVRVHIPVIPELEGTVFGNVRRKQALFDADTALQERFYREALREAGA